MKLGERPLREATTEQLAEAHPLLEPGDVPTVAGAAAGRGNPGEEAAALRAACGALEAD